MDAAGATSPHQPAKATTEFDRAIAVRATGEPGRFSSEVDAGWTVVGKPNGGYLLANLANAAGEAVVAAGAPHRDPMAATAHYLRAPDPGPTEIHTEVLRLGRGASQARATLFQGGKPYVDATFTLGTLTDDPPPPWWTGRTGFDVPPIADCIRLPARREGADFEVAIMDRADIRLDPAIMGWTRGERSSDAELRGWIAFADGRPVDALGLLFFLDALPPATFPLAPTGWVPTLSLTAYVRALPVAGPLKVCQRAHSIDQDQVDESCEIWDASGRLVAQSTQLAGIRLPDGAEPPAPVSPL